MIKIIYNENKESKMPAQMVDFAYDIAETVEKFHKTFPVYGPTPLKSLEKFAQNTGIKSCYVKDESFRFGLNAFKVLGASYAIGSYLCEQSGENIQNMTYEKLTSEETKAKIGDITFISATDGNHGRGVAWTANQLGQKSIILMPKGSAEERLENIKLAGADAQITDLSYDDTVRSAVKMADENNYVLAQDTVLAGFKEFPTHISQGYMTMSMETFDQLPEVPTHIFVQAGVGSMAASVVAFFANVYGGDLPTFVVVEPSKADCFFKTAQAADGEIHFYEGEMETIMAGLACGEPNPDAWGILHEYADFFISADDHIAKTGMKILGKAQDDEKIISGESGAAAFGAVAEILQNPEYADIKNQLGINEKSVLLFFSTEGDTDKANYQKILSE